MVINDIPTIHVQEESDNTNADVKPNILCQNQKPKIDVGMFKGSIDLPSFPREEINAEQSQKKCNFLNQLLNVLTLVKLAELRRKANSHRKRKEMLWQFSLPCSEPENHLSRVVLRFFGFRHGQILH